MTPSSDPQTLANLLMGQTRDAALLVGAGVSAAVSGAAPAATWPGLLMSGIRFCEDNVPGLPASFVQGLERLLESPDVDTLVTVAEGISGKLGAPDGESFARWLDESIGSLEARDDRLVKALAGLDLPIASTNYDDLLAGLASASPVTWKSARKVREVLHRKRQAIIHLHGHWDDPGSVILGGRSYGELIGDATAQVMIQSLFYSHSLVAVGCREGLVDPNFTQLRNWLLGVDPNAPYYVLVRTEELQSAQRYKPFTPVAYGDEYDDLPLFLERLAACMADKRKASPRQLAGPVLPPDTDPIGRDVEMQQVMGYITGEGDRAASLVITGAPGIGKTFLVSAAMRRPLVVERYGTRRYFLSCSAVSSGTALLSQAARVCGLADDVERWSATGDPRLRIESALSRIETPSLLVLDNLEDALTQSRAATLDTVRFLAEYFDIIVTTRNIPGALPQWVAELPLGPLSASAVRRLIEAWSGPDQEGADLFARNALPYEVPTPLDLRLAGMEARESRAEPPVSDEGAERTRVGELEDRLLGVLVHAADGLPRACIALLLDGEGASAAAALERVGLVQSSDSTVLLVASVRPRLADVAISRRADVSDALSALTQAFDMRSLMIEFPGSVDGLLAALFTRSVGDDAQLSEAVEQLQATLNAQMATGIRLSTAWSSALEAVNEGGDAGLRREVLLGAGQLAVRDGNVAVARAQIDDALELAESEASGIAQVTIAVEAARAARLDDDPDRAAELLDRAAALHPSANDRTTGEIELERAFQALHLDDPDTGEERLRMAIEAFSAADYLPGVVRARQKRGEALRLRGCYQESHEQLEQALEEALAIKDGHVIAHCLFSLGVTARHQQDVEGAVSYQRRAMKAYEEEGNRLGLANMHKELGILCGMQGAFGPGRAHFANAADNYRLTGSSFGLANCLLGEAELEADADRREQAKDRAIRSADLYRAIKHPRVTKAEELFALLG